MTEEAPLTITLKAGTGYDAPWIVVRGDTPDDMSAKLAGLGGVISATIEAANLFKGAGNAAPIVAPAPVPPVAVQAAPASPPGWAQPQAAPIVPNQNNGAVFHPEGITCPACHSAVVFKSITSKKTGKAFQLWTCPNQRSQGDGHYSEFAN